MNPAMRSPLLPWTGWALLFPALLLSLLGILGIYAGETGSETGPVTTLRQIAYLAAALLAFLFVYLADYQRLGRSAYVIYGIVIALLVLLLAAKRIPMSPIIQPRRNAYRWIDFGPVSLQVSELAKVAFVLALAAYLRFRELQSSIVRLVGPLVLTAIPTVLVLAEPDLGTALLFLPTAFVMLFAAGARWLHLAVMAIALCVAAPAFYFSPFMSEYQRSRVRVVLRQNQDDPRWHMSAGFQLRQSKIALGSGRLLGRGLDESDFFRHKMLPEDHNDFIFAVLAHQWGFAGSLAVIAAYIMMFAAGLTAASVSQDPLGRLAAVGAVAIIIVQAVVNMGMTMGLLPITGLTLPFASFGGSALIGNYACIALAASVARRRPISVAPRAFDSADE
ncbi:MAG: rod shape-determining protein RodA [Phycisphaerae bacterium]|nr:rod shape-determining protein RodA [Phycisphaerae bacterium]